MSILESSDLAIIGTWIVERINERPVIDRSPASLDFGEQGKLSGNASCNNYFGTYEKEGTNLTLNAVGKTNKICIVEALMEQEARLMEALPAVSSYEISDGILTLKDGSGKTVFRAARQTG
jgi:heat shock protein HslJ